MMVQDVHAWQVRPTDCRTTHVVIIDGQPARVINNRRATRWFPQPGALRADGSAPGELRDGIDLVVSIGGRLSVTWVDRDATLTLVDL